MNRSGSAAQSGSAMKPVRVVKNLFRHLFRTSSPPPPPRPPFNFNKAALRKVVHNSKIGCRRTHVLRGQAGRSYLQAAFLSRSYIVHCAESNGPKFYKTLMFLGQAGMFLSFQARRSSATRSSTSDLTVNQKLK